MSLTKAFGKLGNLLGLKARAAMSNRERLRIWERIYWEYFGMKIDLGGVSIPKYPDKESRWWLIVVAEGLTIDRAFEVCEKRFGAVKWTEESLDDRISSDRSPERGAYAVWARGHHGPDKRHTNYSAHKLFQEGYRGITLLERLLFEVLYHEKIKSRRVWRELQRKHPDMVNSTLCSGSKCDDDGVPFVDRKGSVLFLRRCGVHDFCDCLRPREVAA